MPIPSPYYGNNYVVITGNGATFAVAADPIADPAGYTYYVQYYKPVFGVSGAYTPVTSSNPLPVTVATGLTATISGFTGTIKIEGVASGYPVDVSGNVVVSGLTSAPVYVQTATNCQVEVTGGRYLGRLNDSVSVFGPSGSTWVFANLVSTNGNALGTTANPMYVSIQGATIQATISATVGVTNSPAGVGLMIQGMSGGISVATTVGNTVGINDTAILASLAGISSSLGTLNSQILSIAGSVPSSFKTGNLTATSSAAAIDSTGFTCTNGINLKSAATNTTLVYIGNTGSITSGSTGTYAIDPGEEYFLKINNTNKVFVVSTVNTTVYYSAS